MTTDIYNIIATVIGAVAVGFALFVYVSRSRKVILLAKLSDDVLWTVHYLMIGGFSGAALNIMAIFRESVFYNLDKKWASSRIWLYVFLGITVGSCLLTWEGPISLLPMIGSCCAVVSFWMKNPLHIRLLALPAQILWLTYGALHGTIPGMIGSSISLVSIIIGFIRDVSASKKETK